MHAGRGAIFLFITSKANQARCPSLDQPSIAEPFILPVRISSAATFRANGTASDASLE
jgi:hypothetical protein